MTNPTFTTAELEGRAQHSHPALVKDCIAALHQRDAEIAEWKETWHIACEENDRRAAEIKRLKSYTLADTMCDQAVENGRKWLEVRKERDAAKAEIARLTEELSVTDKLLAERQRVLDAIPPCPAHGPCIPHALDWIAARLASTKEKPDV